MILGTKYEVETNGTCTVPRSTVQPSEQNVFVRCVSTNYSTWYWSTVQYQYHSVNYNLIHDSLLFTGTNTPVPIFLLLTYGLCLML